MHLKDRVIFLPNERDVLFTRESCRCADMAGLLELLQSPAHRSKSPSGRAIHQQESTTRLLHQLRDVGALKPTAGHALLATLDLAAVLLDGQGRSEAAEQLRDPELTAFLAGERL